MRLSYNPDNRTGILVLANVELRPGTNELDDSQAEKVKAHPQYADLVAKGLLGELKDVPAAKKDETPKKTPAKRQKRTAPGTLDLV